MKNNYKGFTLIELISVITILGLLILLAIPKITGLIGINKEEAKNKIDKSIISAAINYVVDNNIEGEYKITLDNLCNEYIDCPIVNPISEENLDVCIERKMVDGVYKYSLSDDLESCTNTYLTCEFDGELIQGAEYVNGQYIYRYMQRYNNVEWTNIEDDGWGVALTDKQSTAPITSKLCSSINNKAIVSMTNMFRESKATKIDLSSFDTSNVIDMNSMFFESKATNIIGLEKMDTSKVTNMQSMFGKTELTNIDLSNFSTTNVTNMSYMFFDSKATNINISSFDTSNVSNMRQIFYNSKAVTLDLSNWDTSNVTNMSDMFLDASTITVYAKTQEDVDRFNNTTNKPDTLTFIVKSN